MSKSALGLLILALVSGLIHWSLPQGSATLPLIASGVFGVMFLIALIVGRRFKFDPVLR